MHRIAPVDPLGSDALGLLRLAAIEARELYPELFSGDAVWPTNVSTPPRGLYVVAYDELNTPLGMGAHQPLDTTTSELRRMYVRRDARRLGLASAILEVIERHAINQGFRTMVLETGYKQLPAIQLYASHGYSRIDAFGPYAGDATSVCFGKSLV